MKIDPTGSLMSFQTCSKQVVITMEPQDQVVLVYKKADGMEGRLCLHHFEGEIKAVELKRIG